MRTTARLIAATALCVSGLAVATGTQASAHDSDSDSGSGHGTAMTKQDRSDLQQVRRSLRHLRHSPAAAEAAGYHSTVECAASPAGGMGVHFVNPALMMKAPDPLRPSILLYAPDDDGDLTLAGVEWFQADEDQDTTTDGDRPSLFGQSFDGPMEGHGGGMPVHYDLHAWLFKHNPTGLFEAWNPKVSCPGVS